MTQPLHSEANAGESELDVLRRREDGYTSQNDYADSEALTTLLYRKKHADRFVFSSNLPYLPSMRRTLSMGH